MSRPVSPATLMHLSALSYAASNPERQRQGRSRPVRSWSTAVDPPSPRDYQVLVHVPAMHWRASVQLRGEQVPASRLLERLAEQAPERAREAVLGGSCAIVFQCGREFPLPSSNNRVVYRDNRKIRGMQLRTAYAYIRVDLPGEAPRVDLRELPAAPAEWSEFTASEQTLLQCTDSEVNRYMGQCFCCGAATLEQELADDPENRCLSCSSELCRCFARFRHLRSWNFASQIV